MSAGAFPKVSTETFRTKNSYRLVGAWIFPEGAAIQEIRGECFAPCGLAWEKNASKFQIAPL